MEKNGETSSRDNFTVIFLVLGSLMLLFGSIYLVEELSIFYGIGIGATVQSLNDNSSVASSVALAATQLQTVHKDILEAYVLFLVALLLTAGAFIMLVRRNERGTASQERYVPFHGALVAVYVLLLYLIFSGPYATILNVYMDVTYAGIVICFACDIYLEYSRRAHPQSKGTKLKRTIAMDPSTPFSNIMSLKDDIFANLNGHLRIIDKHFNSTALGNLHRLMEDSKGNFTKVTVLTSKDMLDSDISNSVSDFKSELASKGIGFEVRLMDDKDAIDQHERVMLDDKIAYKMPPFNIINKKSEHITSISYDQASKRFVYLYGRAIRLDNYMTKQARGPTAPDVP